MTPPTSLQRLLDYYRAAAVAMRGLPVCHPALEVEGVGFRPHGQRQVGVIVTPWFMNLTALPGPGDSAAWIAGRLTQLEFPSGRYEFTVSEAGEAGLIATCSLFTLMHTFADQADARAAAQAAADALFESPPSPAPTQAAPTAPVMSRRRFLRGG